MPKSKSWLLKTDAEEALPLWMRNKKCTITKNEFVFDHAHIGVLVRSRRVASGMSLRAMAKWMGVSHTHLHHLETGKKAWNKDRLKDTTDILDMFERSQTTHLEE
jgi:hypothetical protein